MQSIYFVTEGITDQIVIRGLIAKWLNGKDFVPRYIQPPTSAYAEGLDSNLSNGWKGVVAWCSGRRPKGPAGRDEALKRADCLVIHLDADIATDPEFFDPPIGLGRPTPNDAAEWVREKTLEMLPPDAHHKVLLCVPAQDLEAWIITCLHPDVSDEHAPIENREDPGALLVQRGPIRLVRRQGRTLKKLPERYERALAAIVGGWGNCTAVVAGAPPRCPEALRFEREARVRLA